MVAIAASSGDFDASSSMIESGAIALAALIGGARDEVPTWAWVACWAVTTAGAWVSTFALASALT